MVKVLLVFSSWTGSTKQIAEYIGNTLDKSGFSTTIISANEKIDVEQYQMIVLGTSIHAGKTISSFRKFLKRHHAVLAQKPVAFFVSCANMMHDTEESQNETMDWLNKAISPYTTIEPVSIGLFGGAVVTTGELFDQQNFFVRRIINLMEKNMIAEYGKSDFRDWEKIESWASSLPNHIK